jgi:hypothetical protein
MSDICLHHSITPKSQGSIILIKTGLSLRYYLLPISSRECFRDPPRKHKIGNPDGAGNHCSHEIDGCSHID